MTIHSDRRTVLVIEDDEEIRQLYGEVLGDAGYEVLAATGPEALLLAKDRDLACILLDLMLPDIDGAHMLYYLHQEATTRAIPVIVVSAVPDTITARAREIGAAAVIQKPFAVDDLLACIARVGRSLPPDP